MAKTDDEEIKDLESNEINLDKEMDCEFIAYEDINSMDSSSDEEFS